MKSLLAVVTGLMMLAGSGLNVAQATEQAHQRREARDTRQDARRDARQEARNIKY